MTLHFILPSWLMRVLGVRPLERVERAKDCPSCGWVPVVAPRHLGFQVVCQPTPNGDKYEPLGGCNMRGPSATDSQTAIAAWNRLFKR